MTTASQPGFDVIIIGGSYAGLSAGMALGRALRKVLIIDSGEPCNKQTPHSHNFITHDGGQPHVIAAKAKEQVLRYATVSFVIDKAVKGTKTQTGFTITTASGKMYHSRKLIFASGIKDTLPSLPGFAECWGISVIHCPYCHGYEFRNAKTGIWATGKKAIHLASLVNNLTRDLTLLTSGPATFEPEELGKLKQHNIPVIETRITAIEQKQGQILQVVFDTGETMPFTALYAAVPFTQHSDIPQALGCELNEGGFLKVDEFQETTVTGVFACGDNCAMVRSVANAVHSGNMTGALVNRVLTEENF